MVAARSSALVALAFLSSCSGSTQSTSTNITASGGSVKAADGTIVAVPAGALSHATVITVGNEPNTISINGVVLVGPAHRFGPEGTQFAVPVTVTLPYDPGLLPAGATADDIVVMTAPVGSSDFTPLSTAIVDGTHVSATTTHFSDCVATAPKSSPLDQGMSLADLATLPDQSTSPSDQASSLVDQSAPIDSASSCPHNWSGSGCTLSASGPNCGGTFMLNCAQSSCLCQAPNQNKVCSKPSPMGGCPAEAEVEQIWASCCGYP